jgi:predicted 3-demethylubiquinone-9 3-methyltransferase (glyoxalase superfamily)
MPKINAFLWYDDQAEQAAELYTSVFPNSMITEVVRYGPAGPGPDGTVMTVGFTLDGQEFTALNGGPQYHFTEAVSLMIHCRDQEEVDYYWSRLSEAGEEGPCGWLKDRFGLSWQVVPDKFLELIGDPDQDRSQRAMRAMMEMTKLDVSALTRASDGTPGAP